MSIATKTEFVSDAFETQVQDDEVESLVSTLEDVVAELRKRIDGDDTVENLLRPDGSKYLLKTSMSADDQEPEPLTQQTIIEPILEELGYRDLKTEIAGAASERTNIADYSYALDDGRIDSRQLLIEAEPLNKKLEGRGHGVDQVENWLSQREFESDFGYATDGERWIFIRYDPDSYSHNRIEDIDLSDSLLELFYNLTGEQKPPMEALSQDSLETVENFIQTFERDNFISIAADARQVIREKQEEITDEFYDEYIRIVFGVREGDEERSPRSLVGDGVVAPEEATGEDTRLFAVKTMNRLIFVKFLEDKALVEPDLLRELSEMYDEGMYTESLYKQFVESLFFEVMNNKPEDRSKHVTNVDVFADIPYLNGGLFRPVLGEEELDETEFDIENTVLEEAISLLEKYDFSAEGGPTDLDPSVLGNVFEKTINYLTTDPGDQNKELGAYYTPKEITRFCAEETVRPALRECFEDWLVEEKGWKEVNFEYETVYELIEDFPEKTSFVTEALDEVVDELRVVDPAMGSGHFLTSVLEEIVNVRRALYTKIGWEVSDHQFKKTTVQRNIYGVDIVGPAVEIGKLRLWLSVIGEVTEEDVKELSVGELALPNIAFNLRQGNSLIGYTGFPEVTDDGDTTLHTYQEDTVRSRYKNIIEEIEAYEKAGWEGEPEKAEEHRRNALGLLEDAREGLVGDTHQEFVEAGVEDITAEEVSEFDPFHWVLEFAEVYADGGFDVIVGNPPWDQLRPSRDDFFSRYEENFRMIPPSEKDEIEERLLGDEEINREYEKYQRGIEIQMRYFTDGNLYTLQTPVIDGREDPNENNLSALFLERVYDLISDDGYVAQVLPSVIFSGSFSKDLRMKMLKDSEITALVEFENHGIFEGLHAQYKFGVVAFANSGNTELLRGLFDQRELDILQRLDEEALDIPREVLTEYSRKARIFPSINRKKEVEVLKKILDHPSLDEEIYAAWNVTPHRELDRARASDRFVEEEPEGDYPVYGGRNIYQFVYDDSFLDVEYPSLWSVEEDDPDNSAKYRVRERSFNSGNLKRAIYEEFGGLETSKSQKGFVNDLLKKHRDKKLCMDDVLPDFTGYRVVYRDITNSTNERTLIGTVIPRNIVCVHTLQTFSPYEISPTEDNLSDYPLHSAYKRAYDDEELFVIVGLLNSIPFDFLMRTKVDTHLVRFKLEESQMPRLTEGDDYFEYIWTRAARLNCYGDEFEEMRERLGVEPATKESERREIQAEIDAAAFHAYGLDKEETEFVLDDFHRVQNPRVMDDAYFEMVKRKYEVLD